MPIDTRVGIALSGVSKSFGGNPAVDDVSIEIHEGEFFSLLGPSGCGKTTTLRMIAGFEEPDQGRVVLQGNDVTAVSANKRPVNMVFQKYALFPHMSIYANVAFGIKVKGVPRANQGPRIRELMRIVALEGLERRRPRQLWWAAATGRACAGARQPSGGPAARRAARGPRRQAAKADAARAQAHPERARHDIRLRHARSGRSAFDVRPDRRDERRQGRADREPA